MSNSKKKPKSNKVMICDNLDFILHEEYRLLRTNIKFSLSDEAKCYAIGVTSSVKGEAKTTTAINLAYTLAENEEKVCLLEADMRLPTFAKKMNIPVCTGLSEYLTGQASAQDILKTLSCKQCKMSIIQAGTIPPNPAELLSSARMAKLLETLSDVFTYIIVDLPPLTMVSDALILGEKLDGIVMVVAQPICTKKILKESMRQLMLSHIKILGFVRTFTTNHGFGYSKYGKKKYKYQNGYQYVAQYQKSNAYKKSNNHPNSNR